MQKNMSIKLLVILAISLFLLIPLGIISDQIDEREYYLNIAKEKVAQSWTGDQTITGAVLVIPYTVTTISSHIDPVTKLPATLESKERKFKFVVPDKMHISSEIENDVRYKGIYKVPVYTTNLSFDGEISATVIQNAITAIKAANPRVELHQPHLTVMVSDPRGINSIPALTWNSQTIPFQPGSKLSNHSGGMHALLPKIESLGSGSIAFGFELSLRGMEQLSFVPVGEQTSVEARSNWPHPEFIGAFLPNRREIGNQGYSASWQATAFASNIFENIELCERNICEELDASQFGIKHIETVDIYLLSSRSVKYGFLFIGLSFIAFFIFEAVTKLPVHPIQYALVGAAIAIFYLLLVSLSEHYAFWLSYAAASISCSALLFFYIKAILRSQRLGFIFASATLVLYAVLFVIISLEDFAFLMGALLAFTALAVTMSATRNIDWYAAAGQFQAKQKQAGNKPDDKANVAQANP